MAIFPLIRRLKRLISKVKGGDAQEMFLHELGLHAIDPVPHFMLGSKNYLRKLLSLQDTKVRSFNQQIIITIQGIHYYPTTQEEIFILYEIFWDGIYNFACSWPSIVIDIGMNVGFSSLFFASKANVEKVIGYEPFQPTYKRALENVELNPTLSAKILPINLGIGVRDERRSFDYCEERRGSISITDDPHFRPKEGTRVTQEEATIISADKLFSEIRKDYSDIQVLCKMDCEGAEYDIFQSLSAFRGDQLPGAFMIEWHYKGNQSIIDFFNRRGYLVFSFAHSNQNVGMLYAIRTQA